MQELDLEIFYKTINELWGAKKYKDEEDRNKQEHLIVEALKNYHIDDIQLALRQYWKYKSDKTKPTLQKIIAMLEANKAEYVNKKDFNVVEKSELTIWYENFMKRTDYLKRSLQLAIDDMIDDCKKSLPFEAKQGLFTFTDELKLADANGFTSRIDDYLKKYNKIESGFSMTGQEFEERKDKLFGGAYD